jgi:hypothetical protein
VVHRNRTRFFVTLGALGLAALVSASTAGADGANDGSGAPADATTTTTTAAANAAPTIAGTASAAQVTAPPAEPGASTTTVPARTTELPLAGGVSVAGGSTTTTTTVDPEGPEPPVRAETPVLDSCAPDFLFECPSSSASTARAFVLAGDEPIIYTAAGAAREPVDVPGWMGIPVMLDRPAPNGAKVHWRTTRRSGTAKPGIDYVEASGDLVFPAHGDGQLLQFIYVKLLPQGGTVSKSQIHTVRVVLSKPEGAHFANLSGGGHRIRIAATGVILDYRKPYGPPFTS